MEVILLEKVRNLGNLGEKVVVRPGYGRNFLMPYGKAVSATKANLADFETRRADLEKRAAEQLSVAEKRSESLKELSLELAAKASDEGKLYGSIGTREIANAITSAGIEVSKSEVRMPEGVIRYIGEYDIELQLHSDVTAAIKVNVVIEP
jgi:large subunit ribosomal protein L9